MKTTLMALLVALLGCALLVSCGGPSKTVKRVDPDSVADLSGAWNDTDAKLVAAAMIEDCLARPWLTVFQTQENRKPVVTVGMIRNKSSEHIDTEVFTKDFERELTNAYAVRFVAAPEYRAEIRKERQEQQEFASPETMKKMRNETGADFMLQGSVKSIVDQEGNKATIFYQTDMELINVESMEKVWLGTKEIKKAIQVSGSKF